MEKPHIIKVLEDAKLAHKAGDFVNALSFYEYFFDHALDDDPYALYGMRLHHCIDGWLQLAREFVGAHQRLEQKRQDALMEYQAAQRPEKFHDYCVISRGLEQTEDIVQQFKQIYRADFRRAAPLIKFVWDDLITAEQWAVCNAFLSEPIQKLDESFALFDEACRLREMDASFANDAFEQHILDKLIASVRELIEVLRHSNRPADIADIQRKFFEIAQARSHAGLNKLIQAQGSFLFNGH